MTYSKGIKGNMPNYISPSPVHRYSKGCNGYSWHTRVTTALQRRLREPPAHWKRMTPTHTMHVHELYKVHLYTITHQCTNTSSLHYDPLSQVHRKRQLLPHMLIHVLAAGNNYAPNNEYALSNGISIYLSIHSHEMSVLSGFSLGVFSAVQCHTTFCLILLRLCI